MVILYKLYDSALFECFCGYMFRCMFVCVCEYPVCVCEYPAWTSKKMCVSAFAFVVCRDFPARLINYATRFVYAFEFWWCDVFHNLGARSRHSCSYWLLPHVRLHATILSRFVRSLIIFTSPGRWCVTFVHLRSDLQSSTLRHPTHVVAVKTLVAAAVAPNTSNHVRVIAAGCLRQR